MSLVGTSAGTPASCQGPYKLHLSNNINVFCNSLLVKGAVPTPVISPVVHSIEAGILFWPPYDPLACTTSVSSVGKFKAFGRIVGSSFASSKTGAAPCLLEIDVDKQ